LAVAVAAIAASSGLAGSVVGVVVVVAAAFPPPPPPPPDPEPEPEPEPAGIDQRVAAERDALEGLVADSVGAAAEEVRANLRAALALALAFATEALRLAAAPAEGGRLCSEQGVVEPAFATAAAAAAAAAFAEASAAAARRAEVPAARATAAASLAALRSAAVCDGGRFGLAGGTAFALPSRSSLMKYFWAWDRTWRVEWSVWKRKKKRVSGEKKKTKRLKPDTQQPLAATKSDVSKERGRESEQPREKIFEGFGAHGVSFFFPFSLSG